MAAVAYLDHAASTPMHPEVVEAMGEFFDRCYANPTGAHRMAREARAGLWTVICVSGNAPEQDHPALMDLARKHCDKVVVLA